MTTNNTHLLKSASTDLTVQIQKKRWGAKLVRTIKH